jgi:hypothetical protein
MIPESPVIIFTKNFKGKFLLYKEEEKIKKAFPFIMDKYGGFLPLSPSNTAMEVLVRVYIIKAVIFDPISVSSDCHPYICIKVGNQYYNDSEKTKNGTSDKEYMIARHVIYVF